MGWIRERMLTDYAKHGNKLDWASLAEIKILSEIKERFDRMKRWIPNADTWTDKDGKERDFNIDTWDLAEKIYGDVMGMLEKPSPLTDSQGVKK